MKLFNVHLYHVCPKTGVKTDGYKYTYNGSVIKVIVRDNGYSNIVSIREVKPK